MPDVRKHKGSWRKLISELFRGTWPFLRPAIALMVSLACVGSISLVARGIRPALGDGAEELCQNIEAANWWLLLIAVYFFALSTVISLIGLAARVLNSRVH
jgi:hypothetical protein